MSPIAQTILLFLAAVATSGCASPGNPVFNASVKPAHIYAPHEKRGGFGVPDLVVGATGEVRYCQAGLPQLVKARQQQAYIAIAQACGGDSQYTIRGEMMADATGSMMGVDVKCAGNAGRAIVFVCKGAR